MTESVSGKNKSWVGRIGAALLGVAILAVFLEVGLRIAMPHWREFFSGWFMHQIVVPGEGIVITGRPGFDGYFAQNDGDFRAHIKINDFGLRNNEPLTAAANRVWFIGDSMTFGWGVESDEMYSSVAAKLTKIPTYNVASPGTDVCGYQTLIARIPTDILPRAVVVGLILENDIKDYDCATAAAQTANLPAGVLTIEEDMSSLWLPIFGKRFLTESLATYNFFAVILKRVPFINDQLVRLGLVARVHHDDGLLSETVVKSRVSSTAGELANLRRKLPSGGPFLVLVIPSRFELKNDDPNWRALRQNMVRALRQADIETIDLLEPFQAAGFGPTHFAHDGHWSPLGHQLAARAVSDWMKARLSPEVD